MCYVYFKMEMPFLKLKVLDGRAKVLEKREEDAGYDIYAIFDEDIEFLKPGEVKLFRTGLALEFPKNWVFFIAERGSTGSKGIAKRSGIIDSGYRGELFIPLNNTSNKVVVFYKDDKSLKDFKKEIGDEDFTNEGDVELYIKDNYIFYPQSKAIAQGFLLYTPHIEVHIVNELSRSERGEGKLGSSRK